LRTFELIDAAKMKNGVRWSVKHCFTINQKVIDANLNMSLTFQCTIISRKLRQS